MLRVRWLGRVPYEEALDLQHQLAESSSEDYLLLLEHPGVVTLGIRGSHDDILVSPELLGVPVVRADRGGQATFHGPGQLVGYPIVSLPPGHRRVPEHVWRMEQVVIDALADVGLSGATRHGDEPGVWVHSSKGSTWRKICSIGVRVRKGRTLHGFALNVSTDLTFFTRISPCGMDGSVMTSLAEEGLLVDLAEVRDALIRSAARHWAGGRGGEPAEVDVQSVISTQEEAVLVRKARVELQQGGIGYRERKPAWLRSTVVRDQRHVELARRLRGLNLVTVCEEAGCPNLSECWAEGTATIMINGECCTRGCGFCLVDTRKPLPLDPQEPEHVADAVASMGLAYAVITAVARDDLPDGGASAFAKVVEAIRQRCPGTKVELLIPDFKGSKDSLAKVIEVAPDVLNHNLETVARLQRVVRPSASYARSLTLLARVHRAGLVSKSGLMVGLGETFEEVVSAMADLRACGVDILTIGQYLRPSAAHLPVARWWTPEEFDSLARIGKDMGFSHVESSPFTRSSYRASHGAAAASLATGTATTTLGSKVLGSA